MCVLLATVSGVDGFDLRVAAGVPDGSLAEADTHPAAAADVDARAYAPARRSGVRLRANWPCFV